MPDKVVVIPDNNTVEVIETGESVTVINSEVINLLEIGTVGPVGPQGPKGDDASLIASYTHTQASPSTVWIISHNLGYRPSVTAFDTLTRQLIGDIIYSTANSLNLVFSSPVSGTAYLS